MPQPQPQSSEDSVKPALPVVQACYTLPVAGRQAALPDITRWFSPVHINHYAAQPRKCYVEQVPTLFDLNRTYGPDTAAQWLIPFLAYINGATTAERKMNSFQMASCATAIVSNYGYLKLTEIILFVSRLVGGRYGKIFYNAVDPIAITSALAEYFLPERAYSLDAYKSAIQRKNSPPGDDVPADPGRIKEIVNRINNKISNRKNGNA